ncbi:hypothetical protein AB7M45_007754 [Bradyrhizobium elkanii]|uniref:hypothetical protein n=1 Tax=Bradyrhizobium elkanii TaxID=29448 RepID=UPI00096ACD89|nr:hypothetical protein [Bradyrhizobium elkanii]MCW2194981.1 hypothetical protein [Bradyrhizobium elkanii]NWL67320.1 hypothetical protein [Bradyrhizobium elkanii]
MPQIFPGIDDSAVRRGSALVCCEEEEPILWPRCEITGCENGICIGMSKSLCYPHGIEFGSFTKEQFEAYRASRKS